MVEEFSDEVQSSSNEAVTSCTTRRSSSSPWGTTVLRNAWGILRKLEIGDRIPYRASGSLHNDSSTSADRNELVVEYSMDSIFEGLLPALVLPFDPTGNIDAASFSRLASRVASVPGVSGVVVNGHAGEVTSLDFEERRTVVELAADSLAGRLPIISGVAAETPGEAVEHAAAAKAAGAAALLVLPPHLWLIGRDPGAAQKFFRVLTNEVNLPIVVFQYPDKWGGARYSHEELLDITALPGIAAVKDASWEISDYEEDYRMLKAERPHIRVLSANDEHILTSFVIGSDGALLGFGSIAAALISEILDSIGRNDLARARSADERLYPLTKAFYKTEPRARMHTRIKHALAVLGAIDSDTVRQPLQPLSSQEKAAVRDALEQAGLLQGSIDQPA